MTCNKLHLTVLAIGLVSFGAMAESSLALPNVFLAHDNNFGSVEPHPLAQAEFDKFVGTLKSYGVEDFEDFLDFNPVMTFGATGVTATASGATSFGNGGFGIENGSLVENDVLPVMFGGTTEPVDTIINFSQPITAFGLYIIQGGDADGEPPIEPNHNNNPTTFVLRDTINNLEQNVVVQIGPDWGYYNVLFLGLQSPNFAFNQVQILETANIGDGLRDIGDGMLYDNIIVGFIPEPGSFVLVLVGGVCAMFRRSGFRRS